MSNQFNQPGRGLWIALFALVLFSFPFTLIALQHEPAPPVTPSTVHQPPAEVSGEVREKPSEPETVVQCPAACPAPVVQCSGETQADLARGTKDTHVFYKLGEVWKTGDEYIGKTVTVDGEMHRQFTERVFTIEDDGFARDKDMLVISLVPMSDSVIPLQDSFESGKKVRVTGTLQPFDLARLECAFGPLNTESRAGHSFTKNPVLIIGYTEPQKAATFIPAPEPQPSVALPPPQQQEQIVEVIKPVPAPAPEPAPQALPKTASNLPFVGLAGLFLVLTALSVSLCRSAVGNK